MTNPAPTIHFGAAYYPEHWPEERWLEDIRLMQQAGFTVVRMAEFAWSVLEPKEGVFQFDWLDRAIELLAESGISTILDTPTAAPPAWLIQTHPDILPIDENGQQVQFGNRTHYCVNAPHFHEAARRISACMGAHFGNNPHVLGWQLDNEYGRICYCNHCRTSFQRYLKERFSSLEVLNERWTTRYWSQTYLAWEQIPLPTGYHNPGLMLAFRQFVTESYCRYQAVQMDALRPHLADDIWVTHNFMGWFDRYDHYRLAEDLDLASWDWYIGTGKFDYLESGPKHDLIRGFKRQNFWLMETQPGNVNWSTVNNKLWLGETHLMGWHAIAHGADAILYWQWRAALNGQEQYHGTLVDQSGQPRPFFAEAQWLGRELERLGPMLAGAKVSADVAIINDYSSRWSIQAQPHHQDFDYVDHLVHYHRPFAQLGVPVDIISTDAPIRGYNLVIAPALILLTEEWADKLREYVKRGGHLILTARSGMKDEYDALLPARQPGPLAEMAGVEVEEYYALPEPAPVKGNWFEGVSRIWAERLKPTHKDTVVVARYGTSNGWLDEQVAITVKSFGRGLVYYVGAYLDDKTQNDMLGRMAKTALVKPVFDVPPGIEVGKRTTAEKKDYWIILNHRLVKQNIALPWPVHDHLAQVDVEDELTLIPYGVAVLSKRK